jgi:phospholipase/carboxylesterase
MEARRQVRGAGAGSLYAAGTEPLSGAPRAPVKLASIRSRCESGDAVPPSLIHRERPAAGEVQGLLVLHHGRGTDENDLLGLADVLDPSQRLHVAAPRGPLTLPGWPGFHWYAVPRVGFPDHDTFHASFDALAAFHDGLWQETGIAPARTVLGGFSMGSVMSYALGLAAERPRPAGILALSGFIPTVEGWEPDPESRRGLPVFIAHGRNDPIMEVGFARRARDLLEAGGLEVTYHESDAAHHVDPAHVPAAREWLARVVNER